MLHPRRKPFAALVVVVTVTGVAACFTRPGAPEQGGTGDGGLDASSDGSRPDAPGDAGPCLQDMFSDTTAPGCGAWAMPLPSGGSGSVVRDGSNLVMSTSATGNGAIEVACTSATAWPFAAGFQVEVSFLPSDTVSYAKFTARIADKEFGAIVYPGTILPYANGSKLSAGNLVTLPIVIGIAPSGSDGSFLVYHYDNNGDGPFSDSSWPTGLSGSLASASASFELVGEVGSAGPIKWDNLDTCPVL